MAVVKTGLKVDGLIQSKRVFDLLPEKVQKRILRRSVNVASRIVLKKAQELVNEDYGTLKLALGRKVKPFSKKASRGAGGAYAVIGARQAVDALINGKKRWPAKYIHLADAGHIDAKTGRFVPGSKFLQRAQSESQADVDSAVATNLRADIEDAASDAVGGKS